MGVSQVRRPARRHPEGSVPILRPFRALRFDPSSVGDLAAVVAPPYDVIGPAEREPLIARHPANVVRLDLPAEESGDGPDDRYRRAARTLAAWRSDGTLRKDPHPSIYVYEQTYRVPGTDTERVQRGYFARLRLESFGADGGILRHERTLSGPREDRYKLLRATGVNTSPVIGLFEDRSGTPSSNRGRAARGRPDGRRRRPSSALVARCRWRRSGSGRSRGAPCRRRGVADHDRRRASPL